jgi:uncharacterized membrane protein
MLVVSIFNNNKQSIQYGSMVSARVPFVEEAAAEFRSISGREKSAYNEPKGYLENPSNYQSIREIKAAQSTEEYIAASIILVIKGDHTCGPFQSGVSTRKDMGRALIRIATDSQVENCLVGTEVMWMPHELESGQILTQSDLLKKFPDIIPLR